VATVETDTGSYVAVLQWDCLLRLSPEHAVVAEARAVIGDSTIVFCAGCLREAALRMVDGA
jgi:hypothetical protein